MSIMEEKKFIAPDYSSKEEEDDDEIDYDLDLDDDDEEDFEEEVEGRGTSQSSLSSVSIGSSNFKFNNSISNNNMQTSPFGITGSSGSSWGNTTTSTSESAWASQQKSSNNSLGSSNTTWGSSSGTKPWGSTGNSSWSTQSSSNNVNGKTEIDRTKKVVITDFLDIIVETYQSNGKPGLLPRDIYDLMPRFSVWDKIAAYSPEKIYVLCPFAANRFGQDALNWETACKYFCASLNSYLRKPYIACKYIQGNGQPKEQIIRELINNPWNEIDKSSVVCIGINSGLYGQSNIDKIAAENNNIDYIDLDRLLTQMY